MTQQTVNVSRSIATNTMIQWVGYAIRMGLMLIMMSQLARYLGVTEFGTYAFVTSYIAFFRIIAESGVIPVVTKRLSSIEDSVAAAKLLGNVLCLTVTLAMVAIALSWLVLIFLGYDRSEIRPLVLIASAGLLSSVTQGFRAVFQSRLRLDYLVSGDVLEQLVATALVLFVIALQGSLAAIFASLLVGSAANFLNCLVLSRKLVRPEFNLDATLWKELFGQWWPLVLQAGFSVALSNADIMILSAVRGEQAVGYYAAAKKLVTPLSILATSYVAALFPLLCGFYSRGDNASFQRAYRLSFKYLLLFIVPTAMVIAIRSRQIIRLMYGDAYAPSAVVLAILIWSQVLFYGIALGDYLLISINRQRYMVVATAAMATSNVLFNVALVPPLSYLGAAVAAVVSYGAYPVLLSLRAITRPVLGAAIVAGARPTLAALLMGMVMALTSRLHLAASVAVGLATYVGLLLLVGGLNRQDVALLRSALTEHGPIRDKSETPIAP